MIMERTTFFEHYRVCVKDDGSPQELSRSGATITYKAVDVRSGEAVAIKMLSLANVEPGTREQLESQANAAQLLDHFNIAKLHAFGIEDNHFVYVSEYSSGETVDSWIRAHGPMPPEAALRIALQVVSALNAASFHGVRHRAIQPSNLIIVPGATTDGGWPFVKLLNFGLDEVKAGADGDAHFEEHSSLALPFASPEQVQGGTVDFRSEVYSLAATMCFLLTGAIHSAESRQRYVRRFPKALRNLLAHMLRTNPDERPQDPVVFIEEIRECLTRVERRRVLSHRFGVPFAPIIPRPIATRRPWLSRRTLAFAALMLLLGTLAAVLLPERIGRSFRNSQANEPIGIPVGVAEASPETLSAIAQNTAHSNASTSVPSPAPAKVANATSSQARPAAANQPSSSPPPLVASLDQAAVPPVLNEAVPPASATSPAASNTSSPAYSPSNVPNQPSESSPPPAVVSQNQAASAQVVNPQVSPSSSAAAEINNNAPSVAQTVVPSSVKVSPSSTALVAAAPKNSSGQTAAANQVESEPAPPAEAPEGEPAQSSDSTAQQDVSAQSENDDAKVASRDATTTSRSSTTRNKSSSRVAAKQPRKTRFATTTRPSANQARRRVTTTQSSHYRSRSFVSGLPEGAGTFQAQFIGTTPDGRWILGLPSGETTIVRPPASRRYVREPLPRRIRRMIFGSPVVEPPPPAPMYPPEW